jgi:hypothetical protein
MAETGVIRTPDQRVRVFVSSTLGELARERRAVRDAVTRLRLAFEAASAYGRSIAGRRAVEYALNSDQTTATNPLE